MIHFCRRTRSNDACRRYRRHGLWTAARLWRSGQLALRREGGDERCRREGGVLQERGRVAHFTTGALRNRFAVAPRCPQALVPIFVFGRRGDPSCLGREAGRERPGRGARARTRGTRTRGTRTREAGRGASARTRSESPDAEREPGRGARARTRSESPDAASAPFSRAPCTVHRARHPYSRARMRARARARARK